MSRRLLTKSIVFVCSDCMKVYRYGEWIEISREQFEQIIAASHKLEIRRCEECSEYEEYPLGVC